ncbi:MAG: methyltransferase domain-containing protein [Terracidiphilus sp.]
MMESEVLSLLCDPETRFALEFEGGNLRNTATGRIYPVRDGIPLFVSAVTGSNLKSQALYDRIAPGYDLVAGLTRWITRKPDYRPELLSELEIGEGARVLEVAVGTGTNLRYLPDNIDFYGIDLSWGMLRKCRQNLESWHRQAHLFQGEAERLPFRVESFDCVFHVGGINFFTNKARAISEMIWVARSGTRIVIVDEIERAVNDRGRRDPAAQTDLEMKSEAVRCPIDMVPKEMQEIKAREIAGGKLYCLSFRKP